jgi:hypothetical protein
MSPSTAFYAQARAAAPQKRCDIFMLLSVRSGIFVALHLRTT